MDLQVWPGCLACYNAGRLVGEWVDASVAADWRCPVNPSHEEFMCLDDEITWLSHEISAHEATEWSEAVASVEDHEEDAFKIFAKHEGWSKPSDVDLSDFRDRHCGEWDSPEAHAWELITDCGYPDDAPPFFMLRFDEVAWNCDYTYEGGYVFRNF